MQKIDTFNLQWEADHVLEHTKLLDEEFLSKMYQMPLPDFTVQEMYRLRNLLMMTHVHAKALAEQVDSLKEELNKPLWKRLLRK